MLANHGTQDDLLAHCGDDGRWAADASSQERRPTNFIYPISGNAVMRTCEPFGHLMFD
jgi:hypothetical protein